MRKVILILIFSVLIISDMLDIKLGAGLGLSAKNLFLYIALLFILVERALGGGKDILSISIHLPFALLIMLAVFSWALTDTNFSFAQVSTSIRLYQLKSALLDYYLFFLVYYFGVKTTADAISVAKTLLYIILAGNIITVMDVYNIPDLGIIKQIGENEVNNRGRLMGPIGEPNQYASFLDLFIPCYAALALSKSTPFSGRILFLIATIINLICLLLTGSRGGVLGLMVGCIWGIWMLRQQLKFSQLIKTGSVVLPVVAVGIAIVSLKYGSLLMGRLNATAKAGSAMDASAGRTWLWETGLNIMSDHPYSYLIGMGWYSFIDYVGSVPHNSYLWYFFNLGIIGLFLYLLIFRNIFKLLVRSLKLVTEYDQQGPLMSGFLFGLAAMLVSVFFVDLTLPWYFIWAYIGIMAKVATQSIIDRTEPLVAPALKIAAKKGDMLHRVGGGKPLRSGGQFMP